MNICNTFAGVYFLFDGSELVYIGSSNCVVYRVGAHCKEGVKKFDSYECIETPEYKKVEEKLIRYYQPKYNIQCAGNPTNGKGHSCRVGKRAILKRANETAEEYENFVRINEVAEKQYIPDRPMTKCKDCAYRHRHEVHVKGWTWGRRNRCPMENHTEDDDFCSWGVPVEALKELEKPKPLTKEQEANNRRAAKLLEDMLKGD